MARPRRHKGGGCWPVMKAKCSTCPFGRNGDPMIAQGVIERVTKLTHSQICHHPALHGKPETHLCRGARDIQLRLLAAMGLITDATDEAFKEKENDGTTTSK